MSAILATETAGLVPPPARRGLPGVALLRSTHGLQRVMLFSGLVSILVFVVVAALAPVLAPYGFNADRANGVVFGTQQPPSAAHWFGTTVGGLDVLSRVIFGARTALTVIVLAVAISLLVGVPLGVISGYVGGWVDRVLVLVTDALYAFPSLLLAIVVGRGRRGTRSDGTCVGRACMAILPYSTAGRRVPRDMCNNHVRPEGTHDPHHVAKQRAMIPLREHLGRIARRAEIIGPREVLFTTIATTRRQHLLHVNSAQRRT